MPIIQHGSLGSFTAKMATPVRQQHKALSGVRTLDHLAEVTRRAQGASVEFGTSAEPRGLAIKSLKLTEGFEGFLGNLFGKSQQIFFIAWAWDLSGTPVVTYPGPGSDPQQCRIPLKVGKVRQFMGAGIPLFPARMVTGGLSVRIQLWESDAEARAFGKTMAQVATAVQGSKLNNLLSLVALAAGATTATVALVKDAALELAQVLGTILQANSDDYVDFFEGYYPAADGWHPGDEQYAGYASEIVVTKM